MGPYTIVASDPYPVMIEGLGKILAETQDFRLIGTATNSPGLVRLVRDYKPCIALVEYGEYLKDFFQQMSELRAASTTTAVILWVAELAEHEAYRALKSGARGVLRKSAPVDVVLECLQTAATGNIWLLDKVAAPEFAMFLTRKSAARLTPREREIAALACKGLRNRQIAEALSITPGTVKVHLMHIFEKTGIQGRAELAQHGRRLLEEAEAANAVEKATA